LLIIKIVANFMALFCQNISMENSQLYLIISQLGTIEHRSLDQFVRSPYHNRRPELISFCNLLIQSAQTRDQIPYTRAYYFKKIFPGQPYEDKKMRYTISFLNKLVKKFLAIEQLKEDQISEQRLAAKALRKKGLANIYEKEIQSCLKLLEKQSFRNAQYYLDRYLIGYEDYEAFYKRKKSAGKIGEILPKINQAADVYLIATTLKLACMWLSLRVQEQPFQFKSLLIKVLDLIEEQDYYQQFPVIELYYNAYQMLTLTQDDSYFGNFKSLIEQHQLNFPIGELSELYVLAINHIIKQANLGNQSYRKELFEMYKKGLNAAVFLNNGEMNSVTYINIAQAGLAHEAYDWVLAFIEKNKHFLKSSLQKEYYLFNLASYYNKKGNYDQVMEILRTITFDETMLELAARRMLLKIYFELDETDALFSFFDSFKNYIYRHKEVGYGKDNYLNLIKYAKKLTNINPRDQKAVARLTEEIIQTQAIAEKAWLLERVRGLGR